MATIAPMLRGARRRDHLSGTSRAHAVDRWIYVFMAALFIAIVLAGFVPDSLDKVAAVNAGKRPAFPWVMHLHAVLMGTYLLLLLTQTSLAATGNVRWHMRLGLASTVIAPALVIVGLLLAQTIYRETWFAAQAAAPELRAKLEGALSRKESILLVQIRMVVLFPLMLGIGLLARRADAGLHKRMMILATVVVLPPAIDRIEWLPSSFPDSFITTEFYMLVVVLPMLLWDVIRNGYVHRAYWMWAVLSLPFAVALHWLWASPAWHATARQLLGP